MLADTIGVGLRDRGFAVDVVYDGEVALERCGVTEYDVVVLDRDLPVVHGDEVCRSLVAGSATTRILLLTAAAGVAERLAGLELVAEDHLAKPFAVTELTARVRAPARHSRAAAPPVLLHAGAAGPGPARDDEGRRPDPDDPQGIRGPGGTPARGWSGGVSGVVAAQSMGRTHGPVHQRGPSDDDRPAPQTGPSSSPHPNHHRSRLPNPWHVTRVRSRSATLEVSVGRPARVRPRSRLRRGEARELSGQGAQ